VKAMRVDFDPEVQAWYFALSDAPVTTTVRVSDEVAVDIDASDDVIGVEFLLAPAAIEPQVRDELFSRFPAVRTALAALQSAVA
jgi:uncharacterized protein YuzE